MSRVRPALLLAIVVGACAGAALATDFFRWRDGGIERPAPPVVAAPPATPAETRSEPASTGSTEAARLRFEHRGGLIEAWADNLLAGPIEVHLSPTDRAIPGADPALPVTSVIPGYGRRLLTRLPGTTTARFQLDVMRGDPAAQAQDADYAYPLPDAPLRIEQGWGGRYSHSDPENRYGVDFAADIGTPVVAARAGIVMETEAGHAGGGRGGEDIARANFVRIVHEDGSMALYAHLDTGGVLVRPGQRVRRGEVIGRSGDTGFTTGPHLHFAVQVNRGMRLESVPFRMSGPGGLLRFSEPMPAP